MRIFFAVVIILLLAAEGAYWFLEIYQPAEYARAVIPVYESSLVPGAKENAAETVDADDYAAAAEIFDEKKQSLEKTRQGLAALKPPRKMKEFHEDFLSSLSFFISSFESGKKKADFFIRAGELDSEIKNIFEYLKPETPVPPAAPKIVVPKVQELESVWQKHMSKSKAIGGELFKTELTLLLLGEPSFGELKSRWQEAASSFDVLLGLIGLMKPISPIDQASRALTPAQNKQGEEAFKKIEKFTDLLKEALAKNKADDILSSPYAISASQVEASERAFRFHWAIQNFKKVYAR